MLKRKQTVLNSAILTHLFVIDGINVLLGVVLATFFTSAHMGLHLTLNDPVTSGKLMW